MTAKILDGKAVAAIERQRSAARAADFVSKFGRAPGLAVVKVGEEKGEVDPETGTKPDEGNRADREGPEGTKLGSN